MPKSSEYFLTDFGAIGEPSDEQVSRARAYVAGQARDAHDCRLLLDMLGLLPAKRAEKTA